MPHLPVHAACTSGIVQCFISSKSAVHTDVVLPYSLQAACNLRLLVLVVCIRSLIAAAAYTASHDV